MNRDETTRSPRRRAGVRSTCRATRWGPIVDHDAAGRPLALAWTAHDPRATNLRMLDFETATNVDEALLRRESRRRSGAELRRRRRGRPHRLVADGPGAGARATTTRRCRIRGASRAPVGPGGARRRSIRASSIRRRDACGRRTHARSMRETWLAFMGDGGYDLGARAAQIRDDLLALPTASAADMVSDSARRSRVVPDALARSAARSARRRRARRGIHCARRRATLIEHWSGARCGRRCRLSHRARHARCRCARTFSSR